jgi:hypothetical protein
MNGMDTGGSAVVSYLTYWWLGYIGLVTCTASLVILAGRAIL